MPLAGATSVAYFVPATDAEIPAVQALWRSRGQSDLTLEPRGSDKEHIFGVYHEARRSGEVTITADRRDAPGTS